MKPQLCSHAQFAKTRAYIIEHSDIKYIYVLHSFIGASPHHKPCIVLEQTKIIYNDEIGYIFN
jgi:hypothetical protein